MSLIDRFTRDDSEQVRLGRAWPWPPLGGLAFAITTGGRRPRRGARELRRPARSATWRRCSLPGSQGSDLAAPSRDSRRRRSTARSSARSSPTTRVSRVRIWSADGTLLFSTDGSDTPRIQRRAERPAAPRGRARGCAHTLGLLGHRRAERSRAQPPADLRAARGRGRRRDRPDRRGHPRGRPDRVAVLPDPRRRGAAAVPRHDRPVAPRPDRADQRRAFRSPPRRSPRVSR